MNEAADWAVKENLLDGLICTAVLPLTRPQPDLTTLRRRQNLTVAKRPCRKLVDYAPLDAVRIRLLDGADNTETEEVVRVVRRDAVPNGDMAARSVVVPAAASYYTIRTRGRASRSSAACYTAIPVPTPLQYITCHIIYTKAVRVLFPNLVRLVSAVSCIPSIVRKVTVAVRSAVCCLSACKSVAPSRCVLPLSLCRQAVAVRIKIARCCIPSIVA